MQRSQRDLLSLCKKFLLPLNHLINLFDIKPYILDIIASFDPSIREDPLGDGTGSLTKQQFNARVAQALEDIRTAQLIGEIKAKKEKYANAANTVPEERHLYGNVNARFVIKEFSDLECPYCKRFFETPKAVADRSNGQVAVEWFHTPLSFHDPVATNEAVATECVAKLGGNRHREDCRAHSRQMPTSTAATHCA